MACSSLFLKTKAKATSKLTQQQQNKMRPRPFKRVHRRIITTRWRRYKGFYWDGHLECGISIGELRPC